MLRHISLCHPSSHKSALIKCREKRMKRSKESESCVAKRDEGEERDMKNVVSFFVPDTHE